MNNYKKNNIKNYKMNKSMPTITEKKIKNKNMKKNFIYKRR